MYLVLRKCKYDCKILIIILVPDFCPLKPEIARFSIGFRLNYSAGFGVLASWLSRHLTCVALFDTVIRDCVNCLQVHSLFGCVINKIM